MMRAERMPEGDTYPTPSGTMIELAGKSFVTYNIS